MPPRYAYWTILVDDQPTAFRSGSQEELMPTFKRLQQKHASAKMMWWQNGKLWNSRLDAQEAMRARGEMGRAGDFKQRQSRTKDRGLGAERSGPHRNGARAGKVERDHSGKLEWKPKGEGAPRSERPDPAGKPEWKPKGSFKPERSTKLDWKPKSLGAPPKVESKPKSDWKPKPDWKPRASGSGEAKRRSTATTDRKPEWRPKGSFAPDRSARPEWKPKASGSQDLRPSGSEKRKWVPKAEYRKSQGIEAKRDKNWRPGGEHKDPRQKYKDAKKAKWGRFKQTVRKRWEGKQGKKKGD